MGHAGKEVGRLDDGFSCISIDTIAGSASEGCTRRIATLPIGKEGRDDVVSDGNFFHIGADSLYLASPIRHKHPAFIYRQDTQRNVVIVAIQGTPMNPHADLARSWGPRVVGSNDA